MTAEWITAVCAVFGIGIILIGILVNPFKKLNSKLDDLDERTRELETNQKAILGSVRSIASDQVTEVLDAVVSPPSHGVGRSVWKYLILRRNSPQRPWNTSRGMS